jgi:hypothetical protein
LHNFLRKQIPNRYVTPQCTDTENVEVGRITLGLRVDPNEVHDLQRGSTRRTSESAKAVRNKFMFYFNSGGAVSWQDKSVECGGQ